jgi:hypothetical protein
VSSIVFEGCLQFLLKVEEYPIGVGGCAKGVKAVGEFEDSLKTL